MLDTVEEQHAALVRRTFNKLSSFREALMHAGVGLGGEGAEFMDGAKKHWAYNKPLDAHNDQGQTLFENLVEELGDLEYFMEAARTLLNVSRTYVLQQNCDKVNKRYPLGTYSDTAAQTRADKLVAPSTDM